MFRYKKQQNATGYSTALINSQHHSFKFILKNFSDIIHIDIYVNIFPDDLLHIIFLLTLFTNEFYIVVFEQIGNVTVMCWSDF